jgi:hypothetical protein
MFHVVYTDMLVEGDTKDSRSQIQIPKVLCETQMLPGLFAIYLPLPEIMNLKIMHILFTHTFN